MKNFITILILGLGLFFVSCADNPDITNPPAQYTNEADPKYLRPGEYQKTSGYNFQEDFIYHEWKGEKSDIKYIPFNFGYWNENEGSWVRWITTPAWAVKKIVSSKYFDIYVDVTVGQPAYKKALTIKDTVWDKLIKDLESLYHKVTNVYGAPTDVDGNGKIEIVFHENTNYGMTTNHGGYFNEANVNKRYYRSGRMDIIYANSFYYISNNMEKFSSDSIDTIMHEFQHDIEFNRNYQSYYCYNEALSLSTYIIIHNGSGSGRNANFTKGEIKNGQYFFDWELNSKLIGENYNTAANFMYWLYLHGGSDKIIKDIVSVSKYKQIDHKSIGEAASKNIIQFAGKNHNTVIYWWYLANFYNNLSGILGYQNKATISLSLANAPSGKITLKPKCAVYTTQDMFNKNKDIPNLTVEKLSDRGRNWLILFNHWTNDIMVYINPLSIPIMPRINNYSENEEKLEWYDYVLYEDNNILKNEEENLPPEEINE